MAMDWIGNDPGYDDPYQVALSEESQRQQEEQKPPDNFQAQQIQDTYNPAPPNAQTDEYGNPVSGGGGSYQSDAGAYGAQPLNPWADSNVQAGDQFAYEAQNQGGYGSTQEQAANDLRSVYEEAARQGSGFGGTQESIYGSPPLNLPDQGGYGTAALETGAALLGGAALPNAAWAALPGLVGWNAGPDIPYAEQAQGLIGRVINAENPALGLIPSLGGPNIGNLITENTIPTHLGGALVAAAPFAGELGRGATALRGGLDNFATLAAERALPGELRNAPEAFGGNATRFGLAPPMGGASPEGPLGGFGRNQGLSDIAQDRLFGQGEYGVLARDPSQLHEVLSPEELAAQRANEAAQLKTYDTADLKSRLEKEEGYVDLFRDGLDALMSGQPLPAGLTDPRALWYVGDDLKPEELVLWLRNNLMGLEDSASGFRNELATRYGLPREEGGIRFRYDEGRGRSGGGFTPEEAARMEPPASHVGDWQERLSTNTQGESNYPRYALGMNGGPAEQIQNPLDNFFNTARQIGEARGAGFTPNANGDLIDSEGKLITPGARPGAQFDESGTLIPPKNGGPIPPGFDNRTGGTNPDDWNGLGGPGQKPPGNDFPPTPPGANRGAGGSYEGGGLPPLDQQQDHGWGLMDVLNLPRSLLSGMDLSLYLRQAGYVLNPRHSEEIGGAIADSVKSLASQSAYDSTMAALETAKATNPALRTVELTGLGKNIAGMEEQQAGFNLLDKIPIVGDIYRPFERGTNAWINSLRMNMAEQYSEKAAQLFPDAAKQLQATDIYGRYISRATGRGTTGQLDNWAVPLGQVFFSLRSALAHPQAMAYMNPANLGSDVGRSIARESALDMAWFVGEGMTALYLADKAGGRVGLDPRNSDFGKIVTPGGLHIDIWGGLEPVARTIVQGGLNAAGTATGLDFPNKVTSTGRLNSESAGGVITDFLRNKLSPQASEVAGIGASLLRQNPQGSTLGLNNADLASKLWPEYFGAVPGTTPESVLKLITPLWIQDAVSAFQTGGTASGVGGGIGSFFGLGVGSYQPSDYTQRTLALHDITKQENIQSLLPQREQGKPYEQLSNASKDIVKAALAQQNPELLQKIAQADAKSTDPITVALRDAANSKDAQQNEYHAGVNALFDAMQNGQIPARDGRHALQQLTDNYYAGKAKVDSSPDVKAAYDKLDAQSNSSRLAGSFFSDIKAGIHGEKAGQPAQSDLNPLTDLWYNTDVFKGPDGKINFDALNEWRAGFLQQVGSDPKLLDEFTRNVAPKPLTENDPTLLHLYQGFSQVENEYQAGSWWPAKDAKWTPQEYGDWIGWREANPQKEALLYLFGGVTDLTTRDAAEIIRQTAPGMPIKMK